jgi:hypothetical protein
VSAREPMDWDAYRRGQQRQVTASMVEDFKRREEIRRQHVEDALAAMKPKPLARTPEEVAELCARLEHPMLAARDDPAGAAVSARFDADEAKLMADAEAQRLAAAGQASTAAKEKALAAVLAEIIATTELSDETRARIAELWQK